MTIDELARRSGITTRNIRAYQAKGVLNPPTLEGRTGCYDEGHLARLRLITRLQRKGFSLASVAEILGAWEAGRTIEDLLGLEEELTTPWGEEEPERLSRDDLVAMFPHARPGDVERAVKLGLLVSDGDHYVVPSPALVRAGAGLATLGIPVGALLAVLGRLESQLNEVAEDFVALFDAHVWEPFVDAESTVQTAAVGQTIRRLRPLAFEALERAFAGAMDREIERITVSSLLPRATGQSTEGSAERSRTRPKNRPR